MPPVLSKQLLDTILGREWSFGYNCYEVGHTWTPSCTSAALEVSTAATVKIIPLYAMLYGFSQVAVQQKFDKSASWETIKSVLRSSFFIFFHAYQGSMMGCALRLGFGRFYYRVLVCAPALLSSYLSLLIEKPARRQALAFYLLNLASEIVFRMLVTKGYFKPIRNGETLLFAVSLGVWYRLLKVHGFGHDPVSAIVKVLIGRDEAKSRARLGCPSGTPIGPMICSDKTNDSISLRTNIDSLEHELREINLACNNANEEKMTSMEAEYIDDANCANKLNSLSQKKVTKMMQQMPDKCAKLIESIGHQWFGGKHLCCPHAETTCLDYVIKPISSRFLLGYLIQSALKLSSNPLALLQDPWLAVRDSFTSSQSIKFGLFLVSLVSSGRLTNCLLRRYSNSNEPAWHGLVSGFVAGLSMLWSPKSSLSMYIMWKAVEQYYLLAARQGKAPYFNFTIMTIYSISAATILYFFALEPRFVRPSYMKFLDNLSDHRLHQLNRMVLDVFGTGSSVGYEDFFPDLDPKYMSNQFKELIFNWMIQPYE